MMGSSDYYGYQVVTDNFIPQGIMVISIQYRLGPWGKLGFMEFYIEIVL